MLSLISLMLFGLVVGVIARLLMSSSDTGGFAQAILLGVIGSILGAYFGRWLGLYRENDPASFFMGVLGAILLLITYRLAWTHMSRAT